MRAARGLSGLGVERVEVGGDGFGEIFREEGTAQAQQGGDGGAQGRVGEFEHRLGFDSGVVVAELVEGGEFLGAVTGNEMGGLR